MRLQEIAAKRKEKQRLHVPSRHDRMSATNWYTAAAAVTTVVGALNSEMSTPWGRADTITPHSCDRMQRVWVSDSLMRSSAASVGERSVAIEDDTRTHAHTHMHARTRSFGVLGEQDPLSAEPSCK